MKGTELMPQKESNKQVAALLSKFLATSYVLYVKTQNFHWNLTGPRFHSLHILFEEQYGELASALDEIAERIRMVGSRSPGSMKEFLSSSLIAESEGELTEDEMLQELYQDHMTITKNLTEWIEIVSGIGDEGSSDLMIQRIRSHQKNAWMLKSHFSR